MKKPLFAILWIFSIALGYWAGKNSDSQANPVVSPNPIERVAQNSAPLIEPGQASAKNPEVNTVENESVLPEPALIVEVPNLETERVESGPSVVERMRSNNPLIRLEAFSELLQTPGADSIGGAISAFQELPEGPGRFSELRMLAYSWAQIDPPGAIEWMEELDGLEQRIGTGTVLDSWARVDSASAIAWAKEKFEGQGGDENPYYIGIVSGMAESDLVGATELMTSLPYGRVRGRAASVIFERTWQMGENTAMQWAENLPEGSLQSFAFSEIGKKIAREDMNRAIDWVDGMEESEVKAAVSEDVAERWARNNPVEAAQWVENMPEGEARSESMEEVVTQWARKDPIATAEWLNQFPSGELMDEPIQRFVREVVRKDPEIALTWAESIVNQERRNRTVTEVNRVAERMAEQAQAQANGEPVQNGNPGGGGQRRGPPGSQPR